MLKERIMQFIVYKGISKSEFYRLTGISNGTLDKNSGLSMESVEKFYSVFPELSAEWILTGKGSMLQEPGIVYGEELPKETKAQEPISFYVADTELLATKNELIAVLKKDLEEALTNNKFFRTLIENKIFDNQQIK